MNFEEYRLQTFVNWPQDAPIDAARVARAGFFCIGKGMEVKCFSCLRTISDWVYGDKAMARHRLLNPLCSFVKDPLNTENVPIAEMDRYLRLPQCSRPKTNSGSSGQFGLEYFKYRVLSVRQDSFKAMKKRRRGQPNTTRMAEAGFFFSSQNQLILCAYCGTNYLQYTDNGHDDPLTEHRRLNRDCPFVSRVKVSDMSAVVSSEFPIILRDDQVDMDIDTGLDVEEMKKFGILNSRLPKVSRMMTEDARMLTFEKWRGPVTQNDLTVSPKNLSAAGFFYTEKNDTVRCYHCGGGLNSWLPENDPWIEHARWFPDCDFMRLTKGDEYIQNANNITSTKHPVVVKLSPIVAPPDPHSIFEHLRGLGVRNDPFNVLHSNENSQADRLANATRNQFRTFEHALAQFVENGTDRPGVPLTMTEAMNDSLVTEALSVGMPYARVQSAVRRRLEDTGTMFASIDQLLSASLRLSSPEFISVYEEIASSHVSPSVRRTITSWIRPPRVSLSRVTQSPTSVDVNVTNSTDSEPSVNAQRRRRYLWDDWTSSSEQEVIISSARDATARPESPDVVEVGAQVQVENSDIGTVASYRPGMQFESALPQDHPVIESPPPYLRRVSVESPSPFRLLRSIESPPPYRIGVTESPPSHNRLRAIDSPPPYRGRIRLDSPPPYRSLSPNHMLRPSVIVSRIDIEDANENSNRASVNDSVIDLTDSDHEVEEIYNYQVLTPPTPAYISDEEPDNYHGRHYIDEVLQSAVDDAVDFPGFPRNSIVDREPLELDSDYEDEDHPIIRGSNNRFNDIISVVDLHMARLADVIHDEMIDSNPNHRSNTVPEIVNIVDEAAYSNLTDQDEGINQSMETEPAANQSVAISEIPLPINPESEPRFSEENFTSDNISTSTTIYDNSTTADEVLDTELDLGAYKEENRALKEAKLCKICLDREISILFLTCGHLVVCNMCAANVKDCPICRQPIFGIVRTFLP